MATFAGWSMVTLPYAAWGAEPVDLGADDPAVAERLRTVTSEISDRLERARASERSPTNVFRHNPQFVGRVEELGADIRQKAPFQLENLELVRREHSIEHDSSFQSENSAG